MQVILKQNVNKLGHRGQVVDVAPGYARNYLLPKGIAVKATAGSLKQLELVREKIELEEAQKRKEHQLVAEKLAAATPVIEASANEEGHLYGSVGPREIAEKLQELGFEISAAQVELERHIKQVGEFKANVDLYHEVTCEVTGYVVGPDGLGMPKPEQDASEEESAQEEAADQETPTHEGAQAAEGAGAQDETSVEEGDA